MIRLSASALFVVLIAAAPALAEPTSPWVRDGAAELRLIDAGAGTAPKTRLAAIAIRLEPGWKTYWRQPGASGVPPRFDFSRSENLLEAKVAYPAPERHEDEDGVINVYHGEVVLPVTVTPRDPARPVALRLTADYGVCEAVCVPTRAETALDLAASGASDGPAADGVRKAAAAAPVQKRLGEAGPLAVEAVTRGAPAAGGATVEIAVAAPAGKPLLFAETGDGDFAPAPQPTGPAKDGRARFRITFDEPEPPASGLRLTLAGGGRAIEVPVALDAIGRTP